MRELSPLTLLLLHIRLLAAAASPDEQLSVNGGWLPLLFPFLCFGSQQTGRRAANFLLRVPEPREPAPAQDPAHLGHRPGVRRQHRLPPGTTTPSCSRAAGAGGKEGFQTRPLCDRSANVTQMPKQTCLRRNYCAKYTISAPAGPLLSPFPSRYL